MGGQEPGQQYCCSPTKILTPTYCIIVKILKKSCTDYRYRYPIIPVQKIVLDNTKIKIFWFISGLIAIFTIILNKY